MGVAETVTLHGYRFSVYNRVARMALHEKGTEYTRVEVNPFAPDVPASYRELHPFGKVPVLCHGKFALFETCAITRYIDAAFEGASLTPESPRSVARMTQVIAIIDNYGYWPMVRQVFLHRVWLHGQAASEAEIAVGLRSTIQVLDALEKIASETRVLDGAHFTLADCHLAPMFDYFMRADEGRDALSRYPALSAWWRSVSLRRSFYETDPGLPSKSVDPQ
jgi:glutathione S-transferase